MVSQSSPGDHPEAGRAVPATLEDFDDDHTPAAARAWRAMVCRSAGHLIGVVGRRRRID
jgi:hypothetical protein